MAIDLVKLGTTFIPLIISIVREVFEHVPAEARNPKLEAAINLLVALETFLEVPP